MSEYKFKKGDLAKVICENNTWFGEYFIVEYSETTVPYCSHINGIRICFDQDDLEKVDHIEFQNIFQAIGFVEANEGFEFSWLNCPRWFSSIEEIFIESLDFKDLNKNYSPFKVRRKPKEEKQDPIDLIEDFKKKMDDSFNDMISSLRKEIKC